jgi:hypothetical protein
VYQSPYSLLSVVGYRGTAFAQEEQAMRVVVTSLGFCFILAAMFIASPVSPALAAPWIDVTLSPTLPDHVENPGGALHAYCWVHEAGTIPERLIITILDPDGVEVYREERMASVYEYVSWTVPQDMIDGVYVYRVDYYAVGDETASAVESFLVAGLTTGFCAFKFIDDNGNGEYEPDLGETLASGWEICATPGLGCKLTDADGVACWFFIAPGTYEVCETVQPGYVPSLPECQFVTVASGSIEKVMFGNTPVGACCFHPGGDCTVTTELDCLAEGGSYVGDFTECTEGLCPPTATEPHTWGTVKKLYQ